jgi:hypothetical protein
MYEFVFAGCSFESQIVEFFEGFIEGEEIWVLLVGFGVW